MWELVTVGYLFGFASILALPADIWTSDEEAVSKKSKTGTNRFSGTQTNSKKSTPPIGGDFTPYAVTKFLPLSFKEMGED